MIIADPPLASTAASVREPPQVEVVIEIPRGSCLKRGSTGHIDFVSPLPCPYNYGCVPQFLGLEGDLLDALVLGPRLALGTRIRVKAWGAVTLTDRGMADDKLICCDRAPSLAERRNVLRFFRVYAKCKGLLNFWRGRPGRNACEGWRDADEALARARPRPAAWPGPPVEYLNAPRSLLARIHLKVQRAPPIDRNGGPVLHPRLVVVALEVALRA